MPGARRTLDLGHVDRAAFARDLDALRAELETELSALDGAHLRRMVAWGRACTALGYASAAVVLNPISALLISVGIFARWIVMHHVSHKGYDRVPGVPARYTSRRFAQGWRRYLDWLDWMVPEAWAHEHNILHHARTGEEADPDLVERNAYVLREKGLPAAARYLIVALVSVTWKFSYYAPNTLRELGRARRRRRGQPDALGAEEAAAQLFDLSDPRGRRELLRLVDPRSEDGRALWLRSWLPYAALRFGLIPALFWPLGAAAWSSVLVTSLLAELLTNLHGFVTITPNHTGEDLARFTGRPHDKGEYYLRQVVGSVDYTGGSDLADFLQGYLNYQVEHHLWPDLPMLAYRRAQPRVEAICRRHGVPYVRAPLGSRLAQLLGIMTGRTSMALVAPRPAAE